MTEQHAPSDPPKPRTWKRTASVVFILLAGATISVLVFTQLWNADRAACESLARREGLAGFEVRALLPDGHMDRAAMNGIIGMTDLTLEIEAGLIELEVIPFDLRNSITDTVRALAARAGKKGLELICLIEPDVHELKMQLRRLTEALRRMRQEGIPT